LNHFVDGAIAAQNQDQVGSLAHGFAREDVSMSGSGRGQGARRDTAVGERGNGTL